ncbi:hypothetical protein TruAng_002635 [Truncatella angustata]|nr:hypothetical protein TruAng_002635 [Truncatella angustata]
MSIKNATNPHDYEPLGDRDIRLLELFSDVFDAPLRCRIFIANLDEDPKYEALSYVWGPQEPPYTMYCNGPAAQANDNSSFLLPGSNLYHALRHLRYDPLSGNPYSVILWIDRICINQNDLLERSIQVQLMGDIYEKSVQTIVWLGHEDEYTQAAFNCAEYMFTTSIEAGEDPRPIRFTSTGNWAESFLDRLRRCSFSSLESVEKLTNREWFTRGWILQEVVLPKRVSIQCGQFSMPIELLQGLWRLRTIVGSPKISAASWTMFCVREDFRNNHGSTSSGHKFMATDLSRLVDQRRSAGLSDPRDIVCCLLGLFEPILSRSLSPNYSLGIADVYTNMANHTIQEHGNLHILNYVESPKFQEDKNFPSWVPDLRAPRETLNEMFFRPDWPQKPFFDASRGITPKYNQSLDANQLDICAIFVGTVQQKGDYRDLCTIEDFDLPAVYKYTLQPVAAALRQTIILGQINAGLNPRTEVIGINNSYRRSLSAFFCLPTARVEPIQDVDEVKKIETLYPLSYICEGNVARRSFFCTKLGHIGFCPKSTSTGDHVYILLGYTAPVILRPIGNRFTLIGTCYVHGIMYGEGLSPGMGFDSRHYPGSTPRGAWHMEREHRPTQYFGTTTKQKLESLAGAKLDELVHLNDGLESDRDEKDAYEERDSIYSSSNETESDDGAGDGGDAEDNSTNLDHSARGSDNVEEDKSSNLAYYRQEITDFFKSEDMKYHHVDHYMKRFGAFCGEDEESLRTARDPTATERRFWFTEEEWEPLLIAAQKIAII